VEHDSFTREERKRIPKREREAGKVGKKKEETEKEKDFTLESIAQHMQHNSYRERIIECKKSIKNSQPFLKKIKKSGPLKRGDFLDSHCI